MALLWQRRIYHSARELYGRALAASDDPADLKKGAPLFLQAVRTTPDDLSNPHVADELIVDALKFAKVQGPAFMEEFTRLFKGKGGTQEQIDYVRAKEKKEGPD